MMVFPRLLRAASAAVAAAAGRPSLLAPARPCSWPVFAAALAVEAQDLAQRNEVAAFFTVVVVSVGSGIVIVAQKLGEMREKVAASGKAIADVKAEAARAIADAKEVSRAEIAAASAAIAANKDATSAAVASTYAAIAANKEVASAAVASANATIAANKEATSAAIAANKEATSATIAANKEASNAAVVAMKAELAAAEKIIAGMVAGVSVAAELATLKALKGKPLQ